MKKMWIIFILIFVIFLIALVGMSYSTESTFRAEPLEQQKERDPYKLFVYEIDTTPEKTRAFALEQYKTCPPLRPERFRRRVKILWGVDIRDYPENAIVDFGNPTFSVSLKYQIFFITGEIWITNGPPSLPRGTAHYYSMYRQYAYMNDTTVYEDIEREVEEMHKFVQKKDFRLRDYSSQIYDAYDLFPQLYTGMMSIQPAFIEYTDKHSKNISVFHPHIMVDGFDIPHRVSDIKRDLVTLFVNEQFRKGRTFPSGIPYEKGTLFLGFNLDELKRIKNMDIPTLAAPSYHALSEKSEKHHHNPWRSYYRERSVAAYLSFMLQFQEKDINKSTIMFMSGQLDNTGYVQERNYKTVREAILANDYCGYTVLREFCENPEREMPTLEKVGTSFKGIIKGEKTLLYLEPFPDSYDIDAVYPHETFKAYEMGHDDYYFVEVEKPVESPVAGPDGYAMILDRTEMVYGYLKKSEVREYTDADTLQQTAVSGKGKRGVINDPDGYVNIRKEMNAQSKVLGKIVKKEIFNYWEVPGSNWCVVKTQEGIFGFVYKDRIKEKLNTGGWVILDDD
jgi:hypothetical protein